MDYAREHGTVGGFSGKFTDDELYRQPVDIFIPAANNDTVTPDVARRLAARYIVEGANFPVTLAALPILEQRGIILIPDIIANAGGVIASAEEFSHSVSTAKICKEDIQTLIAAKIAENLHQASGHRRRAAYLPQPGLHPPRRPARLPDHAPPRLGVSWLTG